MRRQGYPYYGKEFLLNTHTNELHDLDNEQTLCQINEIRTEHVVMFDTLQEGLKYQRENAGKQNGCYYCLRSYNTG